MPATTILVPWKVSDAHRWDYDLALVRMEARRRAGGSLSPADQGRLTQFLARLDVEDLVLHYDPNEGFTFVPRRRGIDLDLVREPDPKGTD